jgi:hypothetical protein
VTRSSRLDHGTSESTWVSTLTSEVVRASLSEADADSPAVARDVESAGCSALVREAFPVR